jgi:hypothetical protein
MPGMILGLFVMILPQSALGQVNAPGDMLLHPAHFDSVEVPPSPSLGETSWVDIYHDHNSFYFNSLEEELYDGELEQDEYQDDWESSRQWGKDRCPQ